MTSRRLLLLLLLTALLPRESSGFAAGPSAGTRRHAVFHAPAHRSHAQHIRLVSPSPSPNLDDAALDALIREEVEAAFAGLEETLAGEDDDAALALIQNQGRQVLNNVMEKLEDEGALLSSTLAERIESSMSDQKIELLKKYDEQLGELQNTMNAERANLRAEMEQLQALNKELTELQGPGISRDRIVSGIALLVGLSGVGAALNEALKIAFSAGGDVATLGLNGALGIAGVLYHFQRKG